MTSDDPILTPSSDDQVANILGYLDDEEEVSETVATPKPKEPEKPSKPLKGLAKHPESSSLLESTRLDLHIHQFKSAVAELQKALNSLAPKAISQGLTILFLKSFSDDFLHLRTQVIACILHNALQVTDASKQQKHHGPFINQTVENVSSFESLRTILQTAPDLFLLPTDTEDANHKTVFYTLKAARFNWEKIVQSSDTLKDPVKLAFGKDSSSDAIKSIVRLFIEKLDSPDMLLKQKDSIRHEALEMLKTCFMTEPKEPISAHHASQAEHLTHWLLGAVSADSSALRALCDVLNFALYQKLDDQPAFRTLPQEEQEHRQNALKERQSELHRAFRLGDNERITEDLLASRLEGNFNPILEAFLKALIPFLSDETAAKCCDFICGPSTVGEEVFPYKAGTLREQKLIHMRLKLHQDLGLIPQ